MGRAEAEIAFVTVPHSQEQIAVLVPAPGLLPQLGRLYSRHYQLQRARAIHLLTDDVLHLPQHAETQRHPGKQTGRKATYQAGT